MFFFEKKNQKTSIRLDRCCADHGAGQDGAGGQGAADAGHGDHLGLGQSENGAVTTTRPADDEARATTTDGCALTGMQVAVFTPAGARAASGEEGQLKVRGCSNFAGYLKRPGLY